MNFTTSLYDPFSHERCFHSQSFEWRQSPFFVRLMRDSPINLLSNRWLRDAPQQELFIARRKPSQLLSLLRSRRRSANPSVCWGPPQLPRSHNLHSGPLLQSSFTEVDRMNTAIFECTLTLEEEHSLAVFCCRETLRTNSESAKIPLDLMSQEGKARWILISIQENRHQWKRYEIIYSNVLLVYLWIVQCVHLSSISRELWGTFPLLKFLFFFSAFIPEPQTLIDYLLFSPGTF